MRKFSVNGIYSTYTSKNLFYRKYNYIEHLFQARYSWSSYAVVIGKKEMNLVDYKSLLKHFNFGNVSYKEFV